MDVIQGGMTAEAAAEKAFKRVELREISDRAGLRAYGAPRRRAVLRVEGVGSEALITVLC